MEKGLKKICDLVIKNYINLKEELRFDGDILNHFGALSYADIDEMPISKIKNIRKTIKNKTSRMSYFRGDTLYMISFLISKESNVDEYIDQMIEVYNQMVEAKFEESAHLVLSSYAIVKHSSKEKWKKNIENTMKIYKEMKSKYNDITNCDDYLECTLLALNGIDKEKSAKYMENRFNQVVSLNLFSKNSVQGLTLALMLNTNKPEFNEILELLEEFERKNIKIGHQVLGLLGIASSYEDNTKYVETVKEVIEYISSEEYEYEFYIDKSFRAFIALSIVETYKGFQKEEYLDELMLIVVLLFIRSKKNDTIKDILA